MTIEGESCPPAAHTHDGFFKAIFSQPEHATAFFKSHLPPAISAKVDWPSLTVLPGSFVKSSLQQVHSDLLFSVEIGRQETLLYLLLEHQSTPDHAMPLRLLGYVTEILTRHHKTRGLPLPPILPFVFHQGPEPWPISTSFEDLFELSNEITADLLPYLPKFRYALLDLTVSDPTTGEEDLRLRAILQLMKLARQKKLLRFFQWLANYSAKDLPDNLLGLMLLYSLHVDSDLDVEGIHHNLATNPELEENVMSVAEQLRAEGRIQGRNEGRNEGLTEGRAAGLRIGKIQVFEEFLDKNPTSQAVLETMSAEKLESLHLALQLEYQARFKGR